MLFHWHKNKLDIRRETMKKMLIALVLVLLLAMMVSTVAFAAAGGVPAVHGVDGRTFGGLVSGLAQIDPLALAAHVSGR
jgi:hypothetical protein